MPNIVTKKSLVLSSSAPPNVQFQLAPNAVAIIVENEGVSHTMIHTPQEAIELGVALIQAAQEAARLALAKTAPLVIANGTHQ